DIALLDHRDVADAMVGGEIVGRRQPVSAAADDHDVVALAWRGGAPGPRPVLMARERVTREREGRVLHGNDGARYIRIRCACGSNGGSVMMVERRRSPMISISKAPLPVSPASPRGT